MKAAYEISIHAPTRGATMSGATEVTTGRFQSTLPREERLYRQTYPICLHMYFNPRSHERSDFASGLFSPVRVNISIHAPTRGATLSYVNFIESLFFYFNPRSHERSDVYMSVAMRDITVFQSTLPREERQQYCTKNLFIFIQYRQ